MLIIKMKKFEYFRKKTRKHDLEAKRQDSGEKKEGKTKHILARITDMRSNKRI